MHNKNGFTLIELIVVVAILGVIMAIGIPGMIQYIRNAKVQALAVELKESIEQAKIEAIKRNSNSTITIYGSSGNNTGKNTIITVDNTEVGSRTVKQAEKVLKIYKSVINGQQISNTLQTNQESTSITFSSNGRITGTATNILITGEQGSDGCGPENVCFRLELTTGGNIRMCNPNLNKAENPQGC